MSSKARSAQNTVSADQQAPSLPLQREPGSSSVLGLRFSVFLLLAASGCCLSTVEGDNLGGDTTAQGCHPAREAAEAEAPAEGMAPRRAERWLPIPDPAAKRACFQRRRPSHAPAQWSKPPSSSLSWSLAEGTSVPPGLTFQQIGYPAVADISGIASGVPDPNPASIDLTVTDDGSDIGHVQVILTVNQ